MQTTKRTRQKDLDDLLKQGLRQTRAQLIDNLRNQVGSFDSQITSTMEAGDPVLQQVASALQASSEKILQAAGELET